jgi:hypothetical protein
MRKLMVLAVAVLTVAVNAAFAVDVGDEPVVSVRSADVRSSPGFLTPIIFTAEYGQTVDVLEVRGDWVRVRVSGTGVEGWLHVSSVAEQKTLRLERSGGSASGGATSREIALAGRGFNQQVEARYKSESGLDFTLVDEMEGYGLPTDELVSFFGVAGLSFGEGGDQ